MPCYLFTYHAFGSWLPDHRRGYVHRGQGILPPDQHMADIYRTNLKQAVITFPATIQRELIIGTLQACEHQQVRCHYIATEPTHAHVLVSWNSNRTWEIVRKQIRSNITRKLNSAHKRQNWFSKSPSRKQVRDRKHFDHLITTYLPKHSGLKWSELQGIFQ
jgi:hypothetical protein